MDVGPTAKVSVSLCVSVCVCMRLVFLRVTVWVCVVPALFQLI